MAALSIIIPTLNEAEGIADALTSLAPMRRRGVEIIVVDGGSDDRSADRARPLCDCVLVAPRGRASQMNAGAARAHGGVLLFLHADTRLPAEADQLVVAGLAFNRRHWGRFDVQISGRHPLLPLVATMMNLRSRLTGIATGDQAMFVDARTFAAVGGFPAVALMEDIALSRALKQLGRPLCLPACAVTSGRRWETHGVLRTIVLMWRLRLAFFLGTKPGRLARLYGYGAKTS
jgi:rSAM/selenodomain-associated transferase 2